MSNWNDYQYESAPRLEPGDYRVEITDVQESTSKTSGNPMLVVTVRPNGSKINIQNYIVKNEHYNQNMSALFDSFNIERGDFNFLTWIGAIGAAHLKEDDRGYLKVGYFINKAKAEKMPPWEGPLPERQSVTALDNDAGFDDDPPF